MPGDGQEERESQDLYPPVDNLQESKSQDVVPARECLLTKVNSGADGRRFEAGERFPEGYVLANRFRVDSALGRGGMGEVYRADDLELGVPVALKFLPECVASSPTRLTRFRKEIATARLVSHPNSWLGYYSSGFKRTLGSIGLYAPES
jgi:hypothetical protein